MAVLHHLLRCLKREPFRLIPVGSLAKKLEEYYQSLSLPVALEERLEVPV